MSTETRSYDITLQVEFEVAEGVDLTHWVNPDTGARLHRMDGIYEDVRTEEDIYQHLAYNAIFNDVEDASRLDGWGDLERGQVTMRVIRNSVSMEVTP